MIKKEAKMIRIWKLKGEDLTGLGGSMGTDKTEIIFEEYFESLTDAQNFAEKHYNKGKKEKDKIKWVREEKGFTSGDLRWIMYDIAPLKVHRNSVI
jgi:hypothetical protein